MIKIGKNKREAIDWIQDALGPVTPRNIAEDTVNALVAEGLIESEIDEVVLLENLNQDDLRRRARNTIVKNAAQGDRRRIARTAPGQRHHSGDRSVHRHHQRDSHQNVVQQGDSTILVTLDDDQTGGGGKKKKK
jgi:hypothetical protein